MYEVAYFEPIKVKGFSMPQGKGTYGHKKGRPPKKVKKAKKK